MLSACFVLAPCRDRRAYVPRIHGGGVPTAGPVAAGAIAAIAPEGMMIGGTDIDRMTFQEFGQLLPWKAVGGNVANTQPN